MRRFSPYYLLLLTGLGVPCVSGCSALLSAPRAATAEGRNRQLPQTGLPLESRVQVHFGPHRIPFLEAKSDSDLAFALGLVHAHLRLGQMELVRRLSAGRLSEMAGPFTRDIDALLRTLNLGKAAPEIVRTLPAETRGWLERFVEGVNWVVQRSEELPVEFRVLNFEREPWSLQDVVRIARLASADLSWLYYLQALRLHRLPGGPRLLDHIQRHAEDSLPSFEGQTSALESLFGGTGRAGSNSLVIAPRRSRSGSALIASDPHLSLFAPNFWLIVGYRSPSYEVVGLSIPGLPFVGVGRNPRVAWGGTNMRAISSHLYRLSPELEAQATTRTETIGVRAWLDRKVEIRDSPLGPIVSDHELFEAPDGVALALQWVGHQPSDEFSAFLAANRAQSAAEFQSAFQDYAVSAQNMLYADVDGNIGQLLAYRQPVLRDPSRTKATFKNPDNPVVAYRGPLDLPQALNPKSGYIASANNQPTHTEPPLAFNYSDNNRMLRFESLLAEHPMVGLSDLQEWQQDTLSVKAVALRDAVVQACRAAPSPRIPTRGPESEVWRALVEWDGRYEREARGPVAYEALMANLARPLLAHAWPEPELLDFIVGSSYWRPLLTQSLQSLTAAEVCRIVRRALPQAAASFQRFDSWGDKHALALGSPLAKAPWIGDRFLVQSIPSSGSSDTLLKAAHKLTDEASPVTFGASARHLSDLGDPDANYFVLLGGQDGWLKGPYLADQVKLWQSGSYIQVPLTPQAVAAWKQETLWLSPSL